MAVKAIDYKKCNGCLRCYETCPMDVFRLAGEIVYIAYPTDCMACFLCLMDCKQQALHFDPWRSKEMIHPW